MTKWILALGLWMGAPIFASVNPDGSAWIPSMELGGGYDPGHSLQVASVENFSVNPPLFETVNASVGDDSQYQLSMKLPMGRALTLKATYADNNDVQTAGFSSITRPSVTINTYANDFIGTAGLTLYTQAFMPEQDPLWGFNSSPDGRFWYPSFTLTFGNVFGSFHDVAQSNVSNATVTDDRSSSDEQGGISAALPLPGCWTLTASCQQDLWTQYVDTRFPQYSFSKVGMSSGLGLGIHTWFGLNGGDKKRQWNPDGEQGSCEVGLSFGDNWAGGQSFLQAYGLALTYIVSDELSMLCDLTTGTNISYPFSSGPGVSISNQTLNPNYSSIEVAARIYFPKALPHRPWIAQAPPSKSQAAPKADPFGIQMQFNNPSPQ